jgi:Mg-chelatase subunit ChlD
VSGKVNSTRRGDSESTVLTVLTDGRARETQTGHPGPDAFASVEQALPAGDRDGLEL